MFNKRNFVGIIPARGGSKGLVRKNIRPLGGRPLIAWTIEEALQCDVLDSVVVSTEDSEIADIARRYGAEVPFMRPAELATDHAAMVDVCLPANAWLEKAGRYYDVLVLMQPTSPLRSTEDIAAAIAKMETLRARVIVSVCRAEHHPLWMNSLPTDLSLENFLPQEIANKGRQELPEYYRLNGALYVAEVEHLKQGKSFMGTGSYAYIMPADRSVDIDDEMDFALAEFLVSRSH